MLTKNWEILDKRNCIFLVIPIVLGFLTITGLSSTSVQGEVQSLKTDKSSYLQTNKIIFYGTVAPSDYGSQINLEIDGPQGNYIGIFTTTPNTNSSFQIVLDTNIPKIQSEFAQEGTYSAIAFIIDRSTSTPVSFYYSPIPPPPSRPASFQPNLTSIPNKTQSSITQQGQKQNQFSSSTSTNGTLETSQEKPILQNNPPSNYKQPNNAAPVSTPSNITQQTSSKNNCDYTCQQAQMYQKNLPAYQAQSAQQRVCVDRNPDGTCRGWISAQDYANVQQEQQSATINPDIIVVILIVVIILIGIAIAATRRRNDVRVRSRSNIDKDKHYGSVDDGEWKGI